MKRFLGCLHVCVLLLVGVGCDYETVYVGSDAGTAGQPGQGGQGGGVPNDCRNAVIGCTAPLECLEDSNGDFECRMPANSGGIPGTGGQGGDGGITGDGGAGGEGGQGGTPDDGQLYPDEDAFATVVLPILSASCGSGCHNGTVDLGNNESPGGNDFEFDPNDVSASITEFLSPAYTTPNMPAMSEVVVHHSGNRFSSEADKQALIDWIADTLVP